MITEEKKDKGSVSHAQKTTQLENSVVQEHQVAATHKTYSQINKEDLKKEILEELSRETLKKDILKEIEEKNPKFSLLKLAQHPFVLLILGFILTGIIGNWITSSWQSREWSRQQTVQSSEWNRQQLRLVQIREIEQKYGIIDEVTKEVVEYDSAATDALVTLTWKGNDKRLTDEAPDRIKHWKKASKDWRIISQRLLQKLIIHFIDPRVQLIFEDSLDKRAQIDNDVSSLLKQFDENKKLTEDSAFTKKVYATYDSVNKRTSDLRTLVEAMVKDIQSDVQGQRP